MQDHQQNGAGLETPLRNHYFYGQLLGVQNFELETHYAIGARRLLNRLVLGYGVVCGLGVEVSRDGKKVAIASGVAIDKWGREMIVARRTAWIPVPAGVIAEARERAEEGRRACVQVVLCYHECRGDPVEAHAGECGMPDPCVPSTIREQYRVEFRSRCTRPPSPSCEIEHLLDDNRLQYRELAEWVTYQRRCTQLPKDPCIPLANLPASDDADRCQPDDLDITVRPVVASNLLLVELIMALLDREEPDYEYEGGR